MAAHQRPEAAAEPLTEAVSRGKAILRSMMASGRARAALVMIGFIVVLGLGAPLLAPAGPTVQVPGSQLLPPSAEFLLGTDVFGRDVLSRLMYGTRTTLLVVVPAVALGAMIGVLIGSTAGYFGGWWDQLTGRGVDVLLAYPALVVGILVVAALGPGVMNVGIAIAVYNIPIFARVTRASVLRESRLDYVIASQCLGASEARTLARHILPNSLGPVLVQLSVSLGVAVIIEASLSFLGLGVRPPTPSWGNLLRDGKDYLRDTTMLGIAPGVLLTTFILGLNLFADALRDAIRPRGRAQR